MLTVIVLAISALVVSAADPQWTGFPDDIVIEVNNARPSGQNCLLTGKHVISPTNNKVLNRKVFKVVGYNGEKGWDGSPPRENCQINRLFIFQWSGWVKQVMKNRNEGDCLLEVKHVISFTNNQVSGKKVYQVVGYNGKKTVDGNPPGSRCHINRQFTFYSDDDAKHFGK